MLSILASHGLGPGRHPEGGVRAAAGHLGTGVSAGSKVPGPARRWLYLGATLPWVQAALLPSSCS